jgi:hypothetical protein
MKDAHVTKDAKKETPSIVETPLEFTELQDNTIEEKRLKLGLDMRKL